MPVTPHHLRVPALPPPPAAQAAFTAVNGDGPYVVVLPSPPVDAPEDQCAGLSAEAIARDVRRYYPGIDKYLREEPAAVWKAIGSWQDEPYAHDLMRIIMLKAPEQILPHAWFVNRLLDADGWYIHAAWTNPDQAFESFYAYQNRAAAPKVIAAASAAAPASALAIVKAVQGILADGGHAKDFENTVWKYRDIMLGVALRQDLAAAAKLHPAELGATSGLWGGRPDAAAIHAAADDADNLRAEAKAAPAGIIKYYPVTKDPALLRELTGIAAGAAEDAGSAPALYDGIMTILNRGHELPDRARFAIVDNDTFDARRLFDLMTCPSRKDIYTSTFNGLMDRFLARADAEGIALGDIAADPARRARQFSFLEMAGIFGRADAVLERLPEEQRSGILVSALRAAEDTGRAYDVAAIADLVRGVRNPGLLVEFERTMIRDFENARTKGARERLGLLASSYENTHADSLNFPDAIHGITSDPYYALPDNAALAADRLYDAAGRSIQIVTFSKYYEGQAEPDGDASFANMMRFYRRARDHWTIEDEGSYVHIVSRGGEKTVHIFANKPSFDGSDPAKDGIADIRRAWAQMSPAVETDKILFIQRGHSYQLDRKLGQTLPELNAQTPLVFIGSCGEKRIIDRIVEIAPTAQIVGTQATGTMAVNDPLLFEINDRILRAGKPIVWNEVWKTIMSGLHDPRKNDYINPADNDALGFLQAYFVLSRRPPGTVDTPVPPLPAAPLDDPAGVKVAAAAPGLRR